MTQDARPTPRPRNPRPAQDENVDPVDVQHPTPPPAATTAEATMQLAVRVSPEVFARTEELRRLTGRSKRLIVESAVMQLDPSRIGERRS